MAKLKQTASLLILTSFSAVMGCKNTQQPQPAQALQTVSADHHGWLGTETVKTRFGDFNFKGGYPTASSAAALLDQLKFNRAIDVYFTQIPAVAIYESCAGFRIFGAKNSNQFITWENLMDAKTLLLTANTMTLASFGRWPGQWYVT